MNTPSFLNIYSLPQQVNLPVSCIITTYGGNFIAFNQVISLVYPSLNLNTFAPFLGEMHYDIQSIPQTVKTRLSNSKTLNKVFRTFFLHFHSVHDNFSSHSLRSRCFLVTFAPFTTFTPHFRFVHVMEKRIISSKFYSILYHHH